MAGFIGAPAMNFIPAEIEAAGSREPQVRFGPASLPAGRRRDAAPGPVTLGIRPEHLYIAPEGEADFRGRVEIVEKLGGESLAYLQTAFTAEPVTIKLTEEALVRPGDEVAVRVGRERFHLFGESGATL